MSVKKFFNLPNKLVPVTVNVSIYATEYMLMIDRIFSCPAGARYTEGNVDEMNASYQNETKVKVSV